MPKKIPVRQCIGCRTQKPKNEMIRIVRSPEGTVSLDFRGKANGRGAYLCRSSACLKAARKAGALERNLEVSIPQDIFDQLLEEMEKNNE